jgi:hypothetical protein
MAGSLIKIDEQNISSAVSFVDLGGANWDSSYNVYLVTLNDINPTADLSMFVRFLVSNSPDTSANYDKAQKNLRADGAFTNSSATNQTSIGIGSIGSGTEEISNGILYLFNFNESSEYSFITTEMTSRNDQAHLRGFQGGGVLTVAQATNGIRFITDTSTYASGRFVLYGLKK